MGYFVRKTALGLKPINHTVEDEATVYETDGYCMSPGEYIEIQKRSRKNLRYWIIIKMLSKK